MLPKSSQVNARHVKDRPDGATLQAVKKFIILAILLGLGVVAAQKIRAN